MNWTVIRGAIAVAALVTSFGLSMRWAIGQSGHAQHHQSYQSWVNKANQGCCNDQDCKPLEDKDERTSRGFQEVRIEGQWCPVLEHHYLRQGNVPDASVAHVCAWLPDARPGQSPCERLLCFQPRPGI